MTSDDTAVERSMKLLHECLKEINAEPSADALSVTADLRPILTRTATAILASRSGSPVDAADSITQILHRVANDGHWRIHLVRSFSPIVSVGPDEHSGVDVEMPDGSRFDVWGFLANARIGRTTPEANA